MIFNERIIKLYNYNVLFPPILFVIILSIATSPVNATQIKTTHENVSGNISDPECVACHLTSYYEPFLDSKGQKSIINTRNTEPLLSNNEEGDNNYSVFLTIGQKPYQLGPFFKGISNNNETGWSWWDANGYGTDKQKNLILLMLLDNTSGTIRPITGLADPPTWPLASFRKHAGNYSYKADTDPSPIDTQNNYIYRMDLQMTKAIDLREVTSANLSFWTWYLMETDYDYGYVTVSTDGGDTWINLPGTLTTNYDPYSLNLGNGITGVGNYWIQESMNLTQFIGHKILLGFRFKSSLVNDYEGWYIDDIKIMSNTTTILFDDAETSKILSVNVTYPELTLRNITNPLRNSTTLEYSQNTKKVNLYEEINHPGTYAGDFLFDPFAEQYSGNYTVLLDTLINSTPITATTQFSTTIYGCQSCHNKNEFGGETSFIHPEYGGQYSCMYECHTGSRGFLRFGGLPFWGPPLTGNPMHVHEMQYGHNGGFFSGTNYAQTQYNIPSHVMIATCTQCHTSFLHNDNGPDTATIANYTLNGTNISFSSGLHENLMCENCHGTLEYPLIPEYQNQLHETLGDYSPSFTSSESFTDTYIIAVNRTDNLTITINGNNTTTSLELYTIGPVDNTTTALQGPCGSKPCDIVQSLASPINMNISYPYMGTWLVKLIKLEEKDKINYTISSNYPIQKKPIISIPECKDCHNSSAIGKEYTVDFIPDWDPGYAHADIDNDGSLDIQCRMCHNTTHDISIKVCLNCHTKAPVDHPIIEPIFSQYSQEQCLGCHGSLHDVSKGGGADCVSCHDIEGGFAPPDKRINVSSIKQGVHSNINNGTNNISFLTDQVDKACWACHGDGTEPSYGHPINFQNPYSCEDCHNSSGNLSNTNLSLISNLSTIKVFNHIPYPEGKNASSIVNNYGADCRVCHDNSKVIYSDPGLSVAANVSHYASLTNLVSPTLNCNLCHKNTLNSSLYRANLTRHPARTQEVSFCDNCHNTSFLSNDFHSSAPLKIERVHYNGFDWQDGSCSYACHGSDPDIEGYKWCEDCHLENGSGPYLDPGPPAANGTRLNESIPRVYAHTNFSYEINVPNQSGVYPPSMGTQTASSCYSFNNNTLGGTCHGVSVQNISIAGGYFAINNYSSNYSRSSAYHDSVTMDRMPDTKNCVFCHNQIDMDIRIAWGNSTQITGGTHNWNTGNNNSECWNCHISGTEPVDFHSDSMQILDINDCLFCHTTITSQDLGLHSNLSGTSDVENGDCRTCHFETFAMVSGAVNESNTYLCKNCHTYPVTGPNESSIKFTDREHGEAACRDCHIADGTYHQDNPRGSVANTTYVDRDQGGSTTITECPDCHYASNLDDVPFFAPGGGNHTASACSTGGCHNGSGTMISTIHYLNPEDDGDSTNLSISVPVLNTSIVYPGTYVSVNATVSATGDYHFVDGAQYRIMSGMNEIRQWSPMWAVGGNFNGSNKVAISVFQTNLPAGTYSIEVRGMAGGPAQNASIRYYPMNGNVSLSQSTTLTVLPGMGYINGTVTYGSYPIKGVYVSTTSDNNTTGSDGNYSLRLPEGIYTVNASKQPEYYISSVTGVVVNGWNSTTIVNINLERKPNGSISGIVTKIDI